MSFSAAGDALSVRRITQGQERFRPLAEFIQQADARMVNLEAVISDFTCFPSAFSGQPWVTAEPEVLDDLLKYGFNLIGCANNHSMDYAYEGLYQTMDACKRAGVAYAGIGRNLHEAESPAVLELPQGRVGMISVTSSFNMAMRAGTQGPMLPGRPGVNPLRVATEYTVTEEQMAVLKDIAEQTGMNGQHNNAIEAGFILPEPEGVLSFSLSNFRVGEKTEKHTKCHKGDLERITKMIRESVDYLDYIVVMIHSHQIKNVSYNEPAEFLEAFGRACIDAGAAAVIGGGTHQFKPIEIYKGRPIFYSLGDFIFQNHLVKVQPPDYMEFYQVSSYASTVEAVRANRSYGTLPLQSDRGNYLSVIPYFEFEEDRMTKLLLKPIELGFELSETLKGVPGEADEETGRYIADFLSKLSAPYGTQMTYQDGLITVQL
ncbi:MAG: CapA family protein, partial [Clostridia bacterium]